MNLVYLVTKNTDTIEGRGWQLPHKVFKTRELAEQYAGDKWYFEIEEMQVIESLLTAEERTTLVEMKDHYKLEIKRIEELLK